MGFSKDGLLEVDPAPGSRSTFGFAPVSAQGFAPGFGAGFRARLRRWVSRPASALGLALGFAPSSTTGFTTGCELDSLWLSRAETQTAE